MKSNNKSSRKAVIKELRSFSTFAHAFLLSSAPIVTLYLAIFIKISIPLSFIPDQHIEDKWFVIIPLVMFTFFITTVFIFLSFIYKYISSNKQFYLGLYSILTFTYLRFSNPITSNWHFIPISKRIDLNYIDIPFILLSIFLVISFIRKQKSNKIDTSKNIILEDAPISEPSEHDVFDDLLEKINPALFYDSYRFALSIAIIGPWGSGKSSFLNALEHKIENHRFGKKKTGNQDLIFLKFSPFLNHGKEEVTFEFFLQLSNALKPYHGKLSTDLITYAKKLSNLTSDFSLGQLLNLTEYEKNKSSVEELYQSINSAIGQLNKKIIVAVDDLDRLNGEEIIEVLKLIRNSSNFSNTVFLVTMDKKHVLESIKKTESINEHYLDKFFQLELHLNFISDNSIRESIKSCVKQVVKNLKFSKGKIQEIEDSFWNNTIIIDFVRSHRDVKRLINQFFIDYQCIHKDQNITEIDIKDIILLTLLKQKNYDLFTSLKYENSTLLSYDIGSETNIIPPKTSIPTNFILPDSTPYFTNPEDFELEIDGQFLKIGSKLYLKELGVLLINLFGVKNTGAIELSEIPLTSVKNPIKLDLYFERILPESEISNFEYEEIMALDESQILGKLDSKEFKTRKLNAFRKHLIANLDNVTNYERYIMLFSAINSIQPSFHDTRQICELFQKALESNGTERYKFQLSKLLNNQTVPINLRIEVLIKLIDEYHVLETKLLTKAEINVGLIYDIIDYINESHLSKRLIKLNALLENTNSTKETNELIASNFKSKVFQIELQEFLTEVVKEENRQLTIKPVVFEIYKSLEVLIADIERFENSRSIDLQDVREFLNLVSISDNSSGFQFIYYPSFFKPQIEEVLENHQIVFQINSLETYKLLLENRRLSKLMTQHFDSHQFLIVKENYLLVVQIATEKLKSYDSVIDEIKETVKTLSKGGTRYINFYAIGSALIMNDTTYVKIVSTYPKLPPISV